jgi:shikimate kinase
VLTRALAERAPDPRRALALIGPRASGKSTLGIVVAQRLGRVFLDADAELERRAGRAIAEWLPADPAGFRAAEAALLPELLAHPDAVVALGGGAVEDAGSRARLRDHGAVVWLHLAPAAQLRRRAGDRLRPALSALAPAEEIGRLHERRLPWYRECAARCVDTAGERAAAVAALLDAIAEIGLTSARSGR